MANLLLFIIATIGLTNIIVHGKALDLIKIFGSSIREWMHFSSFTKELFSCYECTGFWAGLFCGLITTLYTGQSWLCMFLYAFAGVVVSALYSDLIFFIRSKTDFVLDNEE